jgi:predicted O-methyltransferase YrrM
MDNFETLLNGLDLKLFEKINSQTSNNDKQSLLAVQKAVRELRPGYTFLEIGSYMGGSLQPYLLDGRCEKIYSIDKRPKIAADARGFDHIYLNNTTAVMMEKLAAVAPDKLSKIETIDGDVGDIDAARIAEKPDACFIDGEHTDEATWRDFEFCLKVIKDDGVIIFHDAAIVYNALLRITAEMEKLGKTYRAYNLPDVVFILELGDFPMCRTESIGKMLLNNHVGYLNSLSFNDPYRRFANKPLFRFLRNLKMRYTKQNVSYK